MKTVKLNISPYSKIQINSGIVFKDYKDVVLIILDLKTKHISIGGTTNSSDERIPGIYLDVTEESMFLNENEPEDFIQVEFPEYIGYTIWSSETSGYTVRITLVKDENNG